MHLHLSSGIIRLATSGGRAFFIPALVTPWTPVVTGRDRFNTVGPACSHAVKWIYALLVKPADSMPRTSYGEPFYDIKDRGEGLNIREREGSC